MKKDKLKDKLKEKLAENGVSKDWLEKNFVHITDEEDDEQRH